MPGEVEDLVSAAPHERRGDLEQPRAESFGLPSPCVAAGEGDGLHPGDKLRGELDDLAPDLVLRESLQRELLKAHVLRVANPVLAARAATVTQLEDGELSAASVGRERGDPHPVVVSDSQLCPGVRSFFPHDHAHPVGPACEVQQPGEVCDPGPVSNPVIVAVIGRRPRVHASASSTRFSRSGVCAGRVNPTE